MPFNFLRHAERTIRHSLNHARHQNVQTHWIIVDQDGIGHVVSRRQAEKFMKRTRKG